MRRVPHKSRRLLHGLGASLFVRLALYNCLTGPALGIKRAEGKVEVMLARLAGIDRAARELANAAAHATEGL